MPPQNTPPNNQNEQNIDQLHSIQSNLFKVTDQYREWNKEAHSNNELTRQTLSQTTSLNKIISKSLDISAKINKEIINQKTVTRTIKELQAQSQKILSAYKDTYLSLTSSQKKQVDLLGQQQEKYLSLSKQIDIVTSDLEDQAENIEGLWNNLFNLESKGLQNTREYLGLEHELASALQSEYQMKKDMLDLEQQSHALNEKINGVYKNQAVSSALLQREQAEAAKETMNVLNGLPEIINKSNQALKKHNFTRELFRRIPILDQFHEFPKLFADFGGKGLAILGVVGGIGMTIAKIVELMFKADAQITQISKDFSVTKDHAESIRQYFFEIAGSASKFADLQEGTLLTEQDILEAQNEFNKAFGTAVVMSGQQLAQMAKVKDIIGLSEEAMQGLMTYSLGTGKSIDEIDRTILGTTRIMQAQRGLLLNNREVLEEVLKTTGGIRANFKGNLESLTKAVSQAKLYGTTLEQIQGFSESLLDFDSSIENQLEAELLTGRQINLERARAAALVGDMNTVMNEMVKESGGLDKFLSMNVITQNSLAKAFGMTRDEMSDMLFKQKALIGLRRAGNNEEQKSLTERYEDLQKLGKTHDEIVSALGKDVDRTLAQQSAQEKFNKVIEKLEDIVGRLFSGGLLDRFITWVAGIAEHFSSGGSIFGLLTNSDAYQAAQARVQQQLSVHDAVISPQGAIMISTPKGQIATSAGDSVIATSDPSGVLNGGGKVDMRNVEAKLDKVIELLSKGGNVYLDGKKTGTVQALAYNATL